MSKGFRQGILEELCQRLPWIFFIFFIALIFFLFSVVALVVIDPQEPAYVITTVNVITLAAFLLGSGAVLWKCWSA